LSNLVILPAASAVTEPEAHVVMRSQHAAIDEGIGLDQCWRVIRRHWRLMTALISLGVSLAGIGVFLMTPEYTAKSRLLIEPEPPQLLDVKELLSDPGSTDEHDYYKTQFELLRSRDLAAHVI